jgi:hypothetical protein
MALLVDGELEGWVVGAAGDPFVMEATALCESAEPDIVVCE